MGVKELLIGSLCYLLTSMPLVAAEISNSPMTQADKKMAVFLEEKCSDGLEHIALYSYHMDILNDISYETSPTSVSVIDGAIENMLQDDNHLMAAHCHMLVRPAKKGDESVHLRSLSENLEDMYHKYANRYYYQEVPSPMSFTDNGDGTYDTGGDIYLSIFNDTTAHFYHQEFGKIEHRIVLLEEGMPPRVIAYGLKDDHSCLLRDSVDSLREAKELEQFVMNNCAPDGVIATASQGVMRTERNLKNMRYYYIHSFNEREHEYAQKHCLMGDVKEGCIEPSFNDFVDMINSDTIFYIKDLGYVE